VQLSTLCVTSAFSAVFPGAVPNTQQTVVDEDVSLAVFLECLGQTSTQYIRNGR